MTQATMEKDVTTTNQTASDKKVTISVPNKGTVKTIDAAVDDVLDISNLFSIGAKNGLEVRPSDKKVQDKEVIDALKAGDALSVKNELYHKEYVVRGNQALYELLADIYALALKINMSVSKANILDAMRKKLKDRDIKTQFNTPAMTTVIKYVVGADRATASNYSRVLSVAMEENLAANELAAYISRRGGIGQIHGLEATIAAKKLGEKENKERLDILRDYYSLSRYTSNEKFIYGGETLQHNSEKKTDKETSTFCFFMTTYDEAKDEYTIISAHDLGKTYEDALLRTLFKDATSDLGLLRKGLRRYEEQLLKDMKTPDGLVQRLKIKHEQQDLEQAKLVEAESVSFLADATV
jgi:hypothetical protein